MKIQILFALLATLVLCASGAAVKSQSDTESVPETKAETITAETFNLITGVISQPDILLYRGFHSRPATPNFTGVEYIVYSSEDSNVNISYIQALMVGSTTNASAQIREGGIGYNNVTIRLRSPIGYGFQFWIEIWGSKLMLGDNSW